MLRKDSSITNETQIPLSENHENFFFKNSEELLDWVRDDKKNFTLSDKVYNAMIECFKNDIDSVLVANLLVENVSDIGVVIRKENFQKIFSAYVNRLLEIEDYEKLSKIKRETEKYGLEIP